jgi:hypothetical protein
VVIVGGGGHGLAAAYYLARMHGLKPRRGAREGLARRRQHRAQHGHDPLELPARRSRSASTSSRQALGGAVAGAQLQHRCSASAAMLDADPDLGHELRDRSSGASARRCGCTASPFRDARPPAELRRRVPALDRSRPGRAIRCSRRSEHPDRRRSRATTRSPGAMRARPTRWASTSCRTATVTALDPVRDGAKVVGVETARGSGRAPRVGGRGRRAMHVTTLTETAGLRLPIRDHPRLQAFVSEPMQAGARRDREHAPISGTAISQPVDKGELVIGGAPIVYPPTRRAEATARVRGHGGGDARRCSRVFSARAHAAPMGGHRSTSPRHRRRSSARPRSRGCSSAAAGARRLQGDSDRAARSWRG